MTSLPPSGRADDLAEELRHPPRFILCAYLRLVTGNRCVEMNQETMDEKWGRKFWEGQRKQKEQ